MGQQKFLDSLTSYGGMSNLLKTYSYGEILEQAAALAGVGKTAMEQHPMGGIPKAWPAARISSSCRI